MLRTIGWAVALFYLSACGGEPVAQEPLNLPAKEQTWVKTETVEITKDALMAGPQTETPPIPINETLRKKLATMNPLTKAPAVADRASCMALLEPLDKKRTAVQKAGGLWHAFERSPEAKPYSNHGMQLDSHINQLIFALSHLCQTAEGVPQDELALAINAMVRDKGRSAAREYLIELGEPPTDMDRWLAYAEFAKKNQHRKVSYADLRSLLIKTQGLIDFYEELLQRQVAASSVDAFLSDAVTLLNVVNSFLAQDANLVMATNEETMIPFVNRTEM